MRDSSINYAAEAVIDHAVNGNVFTSQGSQDGIDRQSGVQWKTRFLFDFL